MTTPQILAFSVLAGMMILFVWGRLRYDLVAMLALMAAVACGIVKPDEAFSGFSDDIVIIVASALIVSAAVARSGVVERALSVVTRRVTNVRGQLVLLVGAVTLMSALVKNIGALAMLIPAAFQMAKRSKVAPALFLMPMAFGSLLGGLMTLVGTSPNIIVARVRGEITGVPFGMFDYTPVGAGLALVGLAFLAVAYPLIPKDRRGPASMGEALNIDDYVTEAHVAPGSDAAGKTVSELREAGDGEVRIRAMLRRQGDRVVPLPDTRVGEGDVLMLAGAPEALERMMAKAGLALDGHATRDDERSADEIGVIEAIITADSLLVGRAAGILGLFDRYGVTLLAVSRANTRITERLRDVVLRPGDVIVLQGPLDILPERLSELGCLPLAERQLRLGSVRRGLVPIGILGGAMLLTALGVVPVGMAFFSAAALVILTGALPPREAYDHVEWPIIVMLGALIPVSDALRTTGGTDLIAQWLSHAATSLPAHGAVALILVAAMAVTPFLNNAATVLVMAPIAATFAHDLGMKPDAFLMATAVGAGCDFLTPIGHQCNTLVMGPGGYRFGDYARLGAPLSLLVVIVGVPLILAVWPVR